MKSKFSPRALALMKARKVLNKFYSNVLNGRKITESEIIAEAKNLLRKKEDACWLDNYSFVFELDWKEWELIVQN